MKQKLSKPTIENAIAFAAMKHKGKPDKVGRPYIYHLLGVMLRLETEEERITAMLHDTLEDCGVTAEELRALGYSDKVIEALMFLTKKPEEEDDYEAFITRVATGPLLAIKVKLADLADNMDPSRRTEDNERTRARMEKYRKATYQLEQALASWIVVR